MLGFHTLDARESQLLNWVFREVAGGDPAVFQRAMQGEAERIRTLIATRGVRYENLKSALQPSRRGRQVVFLYDWWEDPSTNYAVAFGQAYLPRLRNTLRSSLLHGDLHSIGRLPVPFEDLERNHTPGARRTVDWRTQYAVYFNNLTQQDIDDLHQLFLTEPRYCGYVDVSFGGPARDYLAATLTHEMLICDRKVLLSHGGDEPILSNEDPMAFGLGNFGYDVVSLLGEYFRTFFSYKIEVGDTPGAEADRLLNLAAITGVLIDVETIDIIVPADKLSKYLLVKQDKLQLMAAIGLHDVTPDELATIIRTKLSQSYIYDLRYASDGTPTFAVTAEFTKLDGTRTRRSLALKYDDEHASVNLVSMY